MKGRLEHDGIVLVETAEVIGVLGIIVSIVFLTMELRQNNELMEADVRATVLTMTTEIWSSAIEDPSLGATAIKDRKGETLTDEEELRLNVTGHSEASFPESS